MEVITYSLKDKQNIRFYEQLSLFTDKTLIEAGQYFRNEIELFKNFVTDNKIGECRSNEEYVVEYIAAGIFLEKYAPYAMSSGYVSSLLLQGLYKVRKGSEALKRVIDPVRGYLSDVLLYSRSLKSESISYKTFKRLISWMKATGEFTEEVKRLELWKTFLKSLPPEKSTTILDNTVAFASYFEEQAMLYLGWYTYNVSNFIEKMRSGYRYREDFLFCGRSEVEYHLNMFGAEVLNRMHKSRFNATGKKTVLLPTCMSNPGNKVCKAAFDGDQLRCKSCSINCMVNQIKFENRSIGVDTILVPHSTYFSEFLKRWKNQEHTGIVGVACVLNLLKGGYEMQNLNIPSQCVFLDHCGCKKHWHATGIPTSLNTKQLSKVLTGDHWPTAANINVIKGRELATAE
jgi:uncharacterized protein